MTPCFYLFLQKTSTEEPIESVAYSVTLYLNSQATYGIHLIKEKSPELNELEPLLRRAELHDTGVVPCEYIIVDL